VDLQQALQYRREWRFYPSTLVPVSEYEQLIGRRTTPQDFADINAIMGDERIDIPTDVTAAHAPATKQWWEAAKERAEKGGKD
jgi:hypothetical protein